MNYRVLRGLSRGHQYFPEGTIVNTSSFQDVDDLTGLIASLEQLAKEGALQATEEEVTYIQADIPFVLDHDEPAQPPAEPTPSEEPPAPEPKKGKK